MKRRNGLRALWSLFTAGSDTYKRPRPVELTSLNAKHSKHYTCVKENLIGIGESQAPKDQTLSIWESYMLDQLYIQSGLPIIFLSFSSKLFRDKGIKENLCRPPSHSFLSVTIFCRPQLKFKTVQKVVTNSQISSLGRTTLWWSSCQASESLQGRYFKREGKFETCRKEVSATAVREKCDSLQKSVTSRYGSASTHC